MIGNNNPSSPRGREVIDPWGDPMTNNNNNTPSATAGGDTMDNTNLILWRERERRQRTVRTLMMFLLMLLLMDGEEGNNNNNRHNRDRLRKRRSKIPATELVKPLETPVFDARQRQDATLRSLVQQHPRYHALVAKNGGNNIDQQVLQWAEQLNSLEKDQFEQEQGLQHRSSSSAEEIIMMEEDDVKKNPEITDTQKVFHYPWNATGFYRGQWKRQKYKTIKKAKSATTTATVTTSQTKIPHENNNNNNNNNNNAITPLDATSAQSQQQQQPQPQPATALEEQLLEMLQQRHEIAGVYILPDQTEIRLRNDHNLTTLQWERMTMDSTGKVFPAPPASLLLPVPVPKSSPPPPPPPGVKMQGDSPAAAAAAATPAAASAVTLTMDSGRAAFQLYSRTIPGMMELSIVDGFVKLYDSTSPGYSTRKDVLLRVRGVLIHSIGRLSLVSNVGVSKSALVIMKNSGGDGGGGEDTTTITSATRQRRRRLQEALSNLKEHHNNDEDDEAKMHIKMDTIRRHAMELYSDEAATLNSGGGGGFTLQSPELFHRRLDGEEDEDAVELSLVDAAAAVHDEEEDAQAITTTTASASRQRQRRVAEMDQKEQTNNNDHLIPPWSDVVIPYPFVRDDADETIRKVRTPAARRMPPREQMLESNAGTCEFEINLNVQELEWTVGAWRNLLTRKLVEIKKLNPYVAGNNNKDDAAAGADGASSSQKESTEVNEVHQVGVSTDSMPGTPSRSKKIVPDQALIMKLVGSIESRNCDFSATLNATALRTDWEATTNKAINYSFYMMLVCLTQIVILLRQLLHSQAQAAATRVSIVCIGWQTVLDALICLGHIYLSLAMQPLFTAFASVAFFKLLIFCVIEMKYMAIIIQARNSANGGQPTEVLRRQVAVLHLRIYVALFGTFILLFYVGDTHRTIAMVTLYSFWVPQIILNVVTEARTPMHKYYIYGMSFTRMIAPLYVFCIRNNFLKEVYPDAPYDPYMCQVLVLWVALQTAVLMAQSKYGARFMIPARFLPPKFDYSRPLPVSMLPPGTTAASMEMHSDSDESLRASSLSPPQDRSRHTTADTTRKRMKKGSHQHRAKISSSHFQESGMTSETTEMSGIDNINNRGGGATSPPSTTTSRLLRPPPPTLDCSICYEPINIRDRQGYMLAPCEHLYHRDCLVRWMDVKMECPTCRTELPAL